MGWSNPKVDSLLQKLDAEFNAKNRKDIVQQVMKLYTDDVPVIPLYYRADMAVTPKELKHFRLAGHQFYETNEAEVWDVK